MHSTNIKKISLPWGQDSVGKQHKGQEGNGSN